MQDNNNDLALSIETEVGSDDLERLGISLQRELSLLDDVLVERATSGAIPEGARAIDAIVIGKLVVKFGPGALMKLGSTIKSWLDRSRARSVEITIDGDTFKLGKASSEQQDELFALFMRRHSPEL